MFVLCHWNDKNDKGQRNIANTSLWRHLGVEVSFFSLMENKLVSSGQVTDDVPILVVKKVNR